MNAKMAPVELDLTKAKLSWRRDGDGSGGRKAEGFQRKDQSDHPPDSPLPQTPVTPKTPTNTVPAAKLTSTIQATLTATAWTTIPTTVVITLIAPSPSSSNPRSSSAVLTVTSSSTSSAFPTITSILASITSFTSPASTPSQSRVGLDTDIEYSSTSTSCTSSRSRTKTKTYTPSSTSIAATALADVIPVATPTSTLDITQKQDHHSTDDGPGGLSPTAEHLLIAFGAIGVFILISTAIYFFIRMKNIDVLSKARGREFNRGGPRGWYGWRERESDYSMEEPPKYAGYTGSLVYASEQKPIPVQQQQQLDSFVSPQRSVPSMVSSQSAAALSRANTQRQDTVRETLLGNPAPFGVSSTPPTQLSATQAFYNMNPSYHPSSNYSQIYNANDTVGGISRQTSDAYDPAQREVNHMSYLSSLSSGFGDQIIIPELGSSQPPNSQAPQRSKKFSWATSVARVPQDSRDTIYTEASLESSPPRFRTINSWVAQQTGHVERQNQANDEISNMPSIPRPLQVSKADAAGTHQRNQSEDPAFKQHPGDEIQLLKGARIPSTILDSKFASN